MFMATWPSGKAKVCKTFITGSNPVVASEIPSELRRDFYFNDGAGGTLRDSETVRIFTSSTAKRSPFPSRGRLKRGRCWGVTVRAGVYLT